MYRTQLLTCWYNGMWIIDLVANIFAVCLYSTARRYSVYYAWTWFACWKVISSHCILTYCTYWTREGKYCTAESIAKFASNSLRPLQLSFISFWLYFRIYTKEMKTKKIEVKKIQEYTQRNNKRIAKMWSLVNVTDQTYCCKIVKSLLVASR